MVVEHFVPKTPGCVIIRVAHVDVEVLASDQEDSSEQDGFAEGLKALHDGTWDVFVFVGSFDKTFVVAEFKEHS
jgi:hypothetical protein